VTAVKLLPFVPRTKAEVRRLPRLTWEPVSGIEPLTCRLQEVRPCAPYALAARMAHVIALEALATLGLTGASFHEPFHADGKRRFMNITEGSDRNCRNRGAHRRLTAMAWNLLTTARSTRGSWLP
jgi:hypothetical protein